LSANNVDAFKKDLISIGNITILLYDFREQIEGTGSRSELGFESSLIHDFMLISLVISEAGKEYVLGLRQ